MRLRSPYRQAKTDREAWAEGRGYDGWTRPPRSIAGEMLEEAVDIPVWGKGLEQHPLTRRQRLALWLIGRVAAVIWYLIAWLRDSLD